MFFPQKNRMMMIALAACCLASSPASARVDIGLNIGVPGPVYAEPTYVAPPVYAAPTYIAPSVEYPAYYHHRHYFHGRRDFHHRH